ncbi:MAG: glycoside hydrolase family 36 N-terminal domain-containing protein, partial [Jatrophihabitantaceae bacterium]
MTSIGSYPISPLGIGRPDGTGTALVVLAGGEPARIGWLGPAAGGLDPAEVSDALGSILAAASVHHSSGRSLPVLPEVARFWQGQPGLRGHRMADDQPGADWSTAFAAAGHSAHPSELDPQRIELVSTDTGRGLSVRTEFESVPGGAVRIRHTLTNDGPGRYLLHGLDVMVPVPDRVAEILDLTGRWGRERSPQRHPVRDGLWLREGRTGRPGPDAPTLLSVGTAGFGFGTGQVWGVHLAWSGNSRHFVERLPTGQTVLGAGELLLPGELVLAEGDSYASPWVYFVASTDGLDGLAEQLHGYLRALPAHPSAPRPVVCNVWEAVYFDHDLDRLRLLADQAAAIGIERFVLDDGWFSSRRDDRSGLGDWTVSAEAWPAG